MQNLFFIGGDRRTVELINLLAKEEKTIYTYGLDKYEFKTNKVIKTKELEEFTKAEEIILPIPFSKDAKTINAPFAEEEISIEDLFSVLKNKKMTGGPFTKEIKEAASNNKIELNDILESEELAILNAIPTAEGAIQIAMEESNEILSDSNVLILGFGRIGKILSKMLNGIGARVYCEARKKEDLARIESYGYEAIDLKELCLHLNKFRYIFNTIPSLILDKEKLDLISRDCLIIDLSSKPGGVDFEYANIIGIKALLSLGLPGKLSPLTTAKYIKRVLNL